MLTRTRLMELLHYNPESGLFSWRVSRGSNSRGSVAGNINKVHGYVLVGVEGRVYRAHCLAFLYMTGKIPKIIDHADGDVANNRWSNLREASNCTNGYNTKLASNNTSGVKGVSLNRLTGKWKASIGVNGKRKHLGVFTDISQAEAAVKAARLELHGEFANHGL